MKTAQLGIELGTRHLRICTRDKEEFLKVKNMIAFDEDAKLKAFGNEAFAMYEKQPYSIHVVKPMEHGVYTGDFQTLVKGKFLQEDAQYIPYADGKKFTLAATVIVGKSGKQIPVMECGAGYETFLDGLDEGSIQQKIEEANYAGNYPGLKIGDLTTDNNNAGNW